MPNAIFTNSNTIHNVTTKLKHIGINPNTFSFIITSTQLGFGKPDPRVFAEILKKSNLQPEQILYIGDRDTVDILPAKDAGFRTCMVYAKSIHADINMESPLSVFEWFES